MTKKETMLWDKITLFEFDNNQIQFNFSDRLARENNWTKSYSKKVIEEYKKFIFLCCISKNGVTPSDQIDQAWHLHLTYTKSYWIDFCKNTLGQEIHHNPTQGGKKEREKFNDFYSSTKEVYLKTFNKLPPEEVWPNNQSRFSEINFKRINIDANWVIKKPKIKLKNVITTICILTIASFFIQAKATNETSGFFIVVLIIIILIIIFSKNKNNHNNGNGCSGGCSSGGDSSHSGCGGDSGCGSGCGGGCGGGD